MAAIVGTKLIPTLLMPLFTRWHRAAPGECKLSGMGNNVTCVLSLNGAPFSESFSILFGEKGYLVFVQESVIEAIEKRGWCWEMDGCEGNYAAMISMNRSDGWQFKSEDKSTKVEAILAAYLEALEIANKWCNNLNKYQS